MAIQNVICGSLHPYQLRVIRNSDSQTPNHIYDINLYINKIPCVSTSTFKFENLKKGSALVPIKIIWEAF